MPRVKHVKARKDYPDQGIKKGDMYYIARMKTGPRSSKTIRSLDPIPQSRLTSSAFLSGWYSAEEEWARSNKDAEAIRAAAEAIETLGQEAQESFDNMPEGLQQGDTGQLLENRVSEAERIAGELETLADDLEGLTEPEEMEDPGDGMDEDAQEAWEQWQEENDHYQSEIARIPEEVESLLSEVPE